MFKLTALFCKPFFNCISTLFVGMMYMLTPKQYLNLKTAMLVLE